MSHNHYAEINLHIVWHTKLSQPLLTPEVEAAVHGSIRRGRSLCRACISMPWAGRKTTCIWL